MAKTPGIRPRPSLGRRLDVAFRHAFPGASTAVLLLLAAGPLGLPGQAELQDAFLLVAVFYWSAHRPLAMSPPVVFVLGVAADLLGNGPPGVTTLVLLLAHGAGMAWREPLSRHGLFGAWLAFLPISAGAALLQWLLTATLAWRLLPAAPALFQATLAAGLYPPLAALLARANATLADPERA